MDRKVVLCVGVRCRCLPPLPSLSCPNFFVERGRAFRWEKLIGTDETAAGSANKGHPEEEGTRGGGRKQTAS